MHRFFDDVVMMIVHSVDMSRLHFLVRSEDPFESRVKIDQEMLE